MKSLTENSFVQIVSRLYALRARNSCSFKEFKNFANLVLRLDPHIRIFHVAGTNGKGSVCAMLESVYRAAGYRVGLFTSPHLINIRERVQIDRSYIPEEDFVRLYAKVDEQAQKSGYQLSFFQYITLIALLYFQERKVDIIILECGIGGRLDDTNIVNADACAITSVAFDHEQMLGNTLEKIAYEKVSIVKENSRLFVGQLPGSVLKVIKQYCLCKKVPIHYSLGVKETNLIGDFQGKNAALAYSMVDGMRDVLPVTEETISYGLVHVFWPARNQSIVLKNGNILILDGGHNTEAILSQERFVRETFGNRQSCLLFSSTKPNHCETCLEIYLPYFSNVVLSNISEKYKRLDDAFFQDLERKYAPKCKFWSVQQIVDFLCQKRAEKFFVTGSLYFIGELVQNLIIAGQLDEKCFYHTGSNDLRAQAENH